MNNMHNPPHPGETLREDVLPALGLSVTDAAKQLGVTRAALSRVLNERAAISPGMALRLEDWLGMENGGRAVYGLPSRLPMTCGKYARQARRKYSATDSLKSSFSVAVAYSHRSGRLQGANSSRSRRLL